MSRFDLNVENKEIERPYKPMLRITYPVDTEKGKRIGLMVMNLLGAKIMEQLAQIGVNSSGDIYLVNDQGHWLKGPSPEDEWRFMFEDFVTNSLASAYPEEWKRIASVENGQFVTGQGLFTFYSINLSELHKQYDLGVAPVNPEETWSIVSFVPAMKLKPVWWNMAMFGLLGGVAVLGILTWYFSGLRLKREAAIKKLEENEKKLTTITESLQDAIIMVDSSGRAGFWNRTAEKILGFQAEEILGKDIHEFIAPESQRPAAARGLKEFSRTGQGLLIGSLREVEALRKDGSRFPAELHLNSIKIAGEYWAVGVLRDVSEKRQAEKDLLESETRYNLAVNGISAGIWDWVDVTSDKEWWSPQFYELLGYDNGEIEANLNNFRSLLHPDDQAHTFTALEDHFTHDRPFIGRIIA